MVNQIISGHNTIYVTKSRKALEEGIDSIFQLNTLEASPYQESVLNA